VPIRNMTDLRRTILSTLIFIACASCSRSGETDVQASPPAAKVDGKEISQQSVAAAVPANDIKRRKAQLESFVSEQLLANAAVSEKLDKEASVIDALEIAKRQVLAKAYLAKRIAALPRPSENEIQTFYDKHPELFAQRRLYRLQEIAITAPPDRIDEITTKFQALTTFKERANWLKDMNIPFTVGVAVKSAEDLPSDLLSTLTKLKDGNAFNIANDTGLTTIQITGIEDEPLTLSQARANVERFLVNQRIGEMINKETERLRHVAKIEYFDPYQ
jgi:EpsD family peptidyl-prolyl cis-trans isomerase